MRLGVCAPLEALEIVTAAGYDYLEPPVTGMLQPERPDSEILPLLREAFASSRLKPETFNLLLPGDLKVVGPAVDAARQQRYLDAAFQRAARLGGQIAVFGSGGARRVPEGWLAADAHTQVLAFLTRCGDAALRHGMAAAIEPLNIAECNFLSSVAEATALAEELGHPAVGVLSDLYHVTHDSQSYAETRGAAIRLLHVHVAGHGRRAPMDADEEYLRGYFAVLKEADYSGRISIEANWDNFGEQAAPARRVLKRAWEAA